MITRNTMSIKNTEYFIARRIATSAGPDSKNVMVRIASLTVAVGVAVMIMSLAVIFGFRNEITGKLIGFGGHVKIVNLDSNNSLETAPIAVNQQLAESVRRLPDTKNIAPYAVKGGIFKTEQAMQGIMLKGVDRSYDWSFYQKLLKEGDLPSVGDTVRTKDILISASLARLMQIGVDNRVEMLFIGEGHAPRRDRFKVSGIYDSQFEELDKLVILTDLRNVQRLNNWTEDQITGYEATTTDFSQLARFNTMIYQQILDNSEDALMTIDIKESFPSLFDWLHAHDVNALVIICIMLLVALFNMISALLIILLERTSMIGTLKALGMNNKSLQKIFLIRSSFIVAKGMLWGNIVGISLALIQQHTQLLKLDPTGYFLSAVPIDLSIGWILTLNICSFIVILALLTIPTLIISYIKPDTTLRYQ